MHDNIESHLVEKRVFKPPKDFSSKARIKSLAQYRRMYRESIRQPAKFWTREAKELVWRSAVEESSRMEAAVREMVRRGKTECFRKLSGSASERPVPEQGGDYLGRRAGRQTHAHLSAIASRSLPVRECAETQRDRKRRSRHHLSAEHPRGGDCDAGLRADRRGALGRLWRIQRRQHSRSDQR